MRHRDELKEQAILSGTLMAVAKGGLAALSMSAVAKAAKVSVGTVYIYFDSKETLLNALYLSCKRELTKTVFVEDPKCEGAVRPIFEGICLAYLRYIAEHQDELLFMSQFRNSPALLAENREIAQRGAMPLLNLLERGKKEGILKDTPTDLMVAYLQGALTDLAAFVESKPKKEREQQRREIARLCWDALKA